MAPKPAKANSPKKPTGANTPKPGAAAAAKKDDYEAAPGDADAVAKEAPKNKEEALAQISFEGLPSCDPDAITAVLAKKYDELAKVFAHYCKFSECKTVEMATRLRLSGFKRLVKDAGLELKVYDIGQISRLFNLKGGAKVGART